METSATELPAILGGQPAVTLEQAQANRWPIITEEDEQAVIEVMRSGNITTHPVARELEREYAKFTGRKFALSHNNGTSALMAAFFAIDLKPGDEVLVPTATFWASVIPMLWLGAVPVFCESAWPRPAGCRGEDHRQNQCDGRRSPVGFAVENDGVAGHRRQARVEDY